jgi:hypothetical protein
MLIGTGIEGVRYLRSFEKMLSCLELGGIMLIFPTGGIFDAYNILKIVLKGYIIYLGFAFFSTAFCFR